MTGGPRGEGGRSQNIVLNVERRMQQEVQCGFTQPLRSICSNAAPLPRNAAFLFRAFNNYLKKKIESFLLPVSLLVDASKQKRSQARNVRHSI